MGTWTIESSFVIQVGTVTGVAITVDYLAGKDAPKIHSGLDLDDGTNPHGTTKADVGLGSADDTSDALKPISTATLNALNLRVEKVTGSSLIEDTSITRLADTSGTNTGDNATNTQYNGLEASKENTSNKSNDVLDIASTSKFPVWKVITDWVIGSFATIANLALKANKASPTFTGVVTLPVGTLNYLPKYTSTGVLGDSSVISTPTGIDVNNLAGNSTVLITANGGNFDPALLFNLGAWSIGVDDSDYDKLKIGNSHSIGTNSQVTIDEFGNIGFGNTVPIHRIDVTGNIRLTGINILGQYTTATEPAYVKGAQFFNTTLNKMRIGGASAYETVTSA